MPHSILSIWDSAVTRTSVKGASVLMIMGRQRSAKHGVRDGGPCHMVPVSLDSSFRLTQVQQQGQRAGQGRSGFAHTAGSHARHRVTAAGALPESLL